MELLATTNAGADEALASLPISIVLELSVRDPEVIAELWARVEGAERDDFALDALRLGVLAIRQACGQIDAGAVRREGERVVGEFKGVLAEHRGFLDRTLVGTLQDYFDPQSGRFNERVDRLLKKDGELEGLLARKLTADDSEMSRLLAAHTGPNSPLAKMLSPDENDGVLKALKDSFSLALDNQRVQVLKEFSLDNKEGALSRLVAELTQNNGQLKTELQEKIDVMLQQFSFDDETSALSRMARTVATTNAAISQHLTLDDDQSALSRLRREIMNLLELHGTKAQTFQEEVRLTLEKMQVRRQEAAASTRHGADFESVVFSVVQAEAQRLGDIATAVGNTTGLIKNCKKGDGLVELGPEAAAAGSKVVVEAKEDASYSLQQAVDEIEAARQNRDAESGLFVFSSKTAPAGMEPVARYGNDVIVIWDADDPTSDVNLRLGLGVARALCTRKVLERKSLAVDFTAIDTAILEIEKQVGELDKIRKWSETIRNNSNEILERVRISSEKLVNQAEILRERVTDIKSLPFVH